MAYAHTPNDNKDWDKLEDHLERVAKKAQDFAAKFGAGDLAFWVGLWHDLGKFNPRFQEYLLAQYEHRSAPKAPHAIWGAALAYDHLYKRKGIANEWKEIALPILAHHTRLVHGGEVKAEFEGFLRDTPHAMALLDRHRKALSRTPKLRLANLSPTDRELRIRMVFSALVDADYLDTEEHFDTYKARARGNWRQLAGLRTSLERSRPSWRSSGSTSVVNAMRDAIYEQCLEAARGPQGVYRLTVPTGGGKTRSSLAFAFEHARIHDNIERVIVAIPYTSIIDQTVQDYRGILGVNAVLEHHSQVDPKQNEGEVDLYSRTRLTIQNWDAHLIVTTTVQLFESLLGNRPGQIRKLHRLANSVIVLDEVQTLPVELLEPTLDVLRALVEQYGVTLVLSTATQAQFEKNPKLKPFHDVAVSEIVPSFDQYFRDLRRVEYNVLPTPLGLDELAESVDAAPQILVVMNSRRDALNLISSLKEKETTDVFHLSTLLCGAHRREILKQVNDRIRAGQSVRLISTQVVEAGVDLDFPTVWRALGPLDRIVQAAGRCNRGGKLAKGQVIIFQLVGEHIPSGPYKIAIEETKATLQAYGSDGLHETTVYRKYFDRLFARIHPSKEGIAIQDARSELNYPEVASSYRLIKDDTVSVLVPYKDGQQRLQEWMKERNRDTWQALHPYLVSVREREAKRSVGIWLEQMPGTDQLYRWLGEYDETATSIGLAEVLSDPSDLKPSDLVI